jgi:hypothetical protein
MSSRFFTYRVRHSSTGGCHGLSSRWREIRNVCHPEVLDISVSLFDLFQAQGDTLLYRFNILAQQVADELPQIEAPYRAVSRCQGRLISFHATLANMSPLFQAFLT